MGFIYRDISQFSYCTTGDKIGPLVKQEVSYKRLKSQGKHFIFDLREKNHLFSLIKANLFSVLIADYGGSGSG